MPRKLDYPPAGLAPDEEPELLDCPKCGKNTSSGHMTGDDNGGVHFRVFCWECNFTTPWYPEFVTAIRKWNRSRFTATMRETTRKKDKNINYKELPALRTSKGLTR